MLRELDQDGRRERDENAGGPAEEDDRTRREHERERNASAVRPLDRDRVAARKGRSGEQGGHPEEHRRRVLLGREHVRGEHHGAEPRDVDRNDDRRHAVRHDPLLSRLTRLPLPVERAWIFQEPHQDGDENQHHNQSDDARSPLEHDASLPLRIADKRDCGLWKTRRNHPFG